MHLVEHILQKAQNYAAQYDVRIFLNYDKIYVRYIFILLCHNISTEFKINDDVLFKAKTLREKDEIEEYLCIVLKDAVDLIYQAWLAKEEALND